MGLVPFEGWNYDLAVAEQRRMAAHAVERGGLEGLRPVAGLDMALGRDGTTCVGVVVRGGAKDTGADAFGGSAQRGSQADGFRVAAGRLGLGEGQGPGGEQEGKREDGGVMVGSVAVEDLLWQDAQD
ncbi:MAG: hypothetical protein RI897_2954 [Verrucomicrobiota bacterium]